MPGRDIPAGADGRENTQASGPNQPGGRKKTGRRRYHHTMTSCAPEVSAQTPQLNRVVNAALLDAISVSVTRVFSILMRPCEIIKLLTEFFKVCLVLVERATELCPFREFVLG